MPNTGNRIMRTMLFLFAVSFCASTASAQVVIEDTNLSFSSFDTPAGIGGNHGSTVCQTLLCTDDTSFGFDYSSGSIQVVLSLLDETADWYVVEFGEQFGAASIAANEHPIIATFDNPGAPVAVGGPEFYLGVSTGVGQRPNADPSVFDPNRDVFGWVHLRDNAGTLEFISSAMVYGGDGIIVGTTTAIPEPATGTGILLIFLAASLSRIRNS